MKKLLFLILATVLTISVFAGCAEKPTETAQSPNLTATPIPSPTPEATASTAESPASAETPPAETASATAVAKPIELIVFAASSMKASLDEIIENYKLVAPNVTIRADYDSSGNLVTKITEGAEADIFISADQKNMNKLTNGEIVEASRFDFAENEIVIVAAPGNPKGIRSFEDAVNADVISIGDPDSVPAGTYAKEIFESLGIWDAVSGKASLAAKVSDVTAQVNEGAVDCGVVFKTEVIKTSLEYFPAPAGALKTPVLYPVAVLSASLNQTAAADFLAYLKTPEAGSVFVSAGFTIPG